VRVEREREKILTCVLSMPDRNVSLLLQNRIYQLLTEARGAHVKLSSPILLFVIEYSISFVAYLNVSISLSVGICMNGFFERSVIEGHCVCDQINLGQNTSGRNV
jgi:hypothetical protein